MKQFLGTVTKTVLDKTATVEVKTVWKHPLYKKTIAKSKKYLVHDQNKTAKVGDTVKFKAVRPISKRKRFILLEVIK